MKTKRMKKLLMSMGLSRDQVNYMVKDQRENGAEGVSNALYYALLRKALLSCGPELLPYVKSFVLSANTDENEKKPADAANTGEPVKG